MHCSWKLLLQDACQLLVRYQASLEYLQMWGMSLDQVVINRAILTSYLSSVFFRKAVDLRKCSWKRRPTSLRASPISSSESPHSRKTMSRSIYNCRHGISDGAVKIKQHIRSFRYRWTPLAHSHETPCFFFCTTTLTTTYERPYHGTVNHCARSYKVCILRHNQSSYEIYKLKPRRSYAG